MNQAVAESRCYALSTMAVRAFPTCILNGKLSFDAVASSKVNRVDKLSKGTWA